MVSAVIPSSSMSHMADNSEDWRDNSVHGMYADGTTSDGTTYGAWLVMNTKVRLIYNEQYTGN